MKNPGTEGRGGGWESSRVDQPDSQGEDPARRCRDWNWSLLPGLDTRRDQLHRSAWSTRTALTWDARTMATWVEEIDARHRELIDHLNEFFRRMEEGPATTLVIEVQRRMSDWIWNHIVRTDTQLRRCVKHEVA